MACSVIPVEHEFKAIGSISGNSERTFGFAGSTQHLCILSGAYTGLHAMFLLTCDSSGTANISTIFKANTVTLTGGTNTLTVKTTTSGTATLYDMPIASGMAYMTAT